MNSHFAEECSLRLLHLFQVGLCVEIQSRLDLRMTKNVLRGFMIFFSLVDQPQLDIGSRASGRGIGSIYEAYILMRARDKLRPAF